MAKILVAGKNPSEREIQALVLEFGGHTCATAGSSEEAVNLLQKGFFDLAVVESGLSGEGSPDQLVESLRAASRNIGVLVLAENGAKLQVSADVLPVPCSPEDFIGRISQVLSKLARARARTVRDQRRFTRYPIHVPCSIKLLRRRETSGGTDIQTVTKNINRGGLSLMVEGDWEVAARIECLIQLSSKPFGDRPPWIHSEGRIVHVTPQDGGVVEIGATIDRFEFVNQPGKARK